MTTHVLKRNRLLTRFSVTKPLNWENQGKFLHIDAFSYGIVLLEIITGKKPGKASGSDTTDVLQELVKTTIVEEKLNDVLDLEPLKIKAHREWTT